MRKTTTAGRRESTSTNYTPAGTAEFGDEPAPTAISGVPKGQGWGAIAAVIAS